MHADPGDRALPHPDENRLAEEIASLRPALSGYVLAIVPHYGACDDVVQETCLFLWDRRHQCRETTNLRAWAFRVARFKALAWRRDRQRERVVFFSEDSLHDIAAAAESLAEEAADRLRALRQCLARLSPEELELLRLKYVERRSLTDHALALSQKPTRVQKTISRLRLALRHCIHSRLTHD